MPDILILGAFGFADGYYAFGKNLEKYFDSVSFFPLFMYQTTDFSQNYLDKCLTDCLNGTMNYESKIGRLINANVKKTHVIFYHNIHYIECNKEKNFYKNIIAKENRDFKLILVNWDPNINETIVNNFFKTEYNKFDLIYMSHLVKIDKNIKSLYAGFLKEISYYKNDDNYKCDVCFVGTNLYTHEMWENKTLNRKIVLDEILKNKDISLHIYGTESIKSSYPGHYKGYIKYDDCYKAFSNATFSLNISPLNNILINGHYYYSERLPQILACNGIMISNNDYGTFLVPNVDYIYINDITKLNDTIIYYKNNPELIAKMRENYKTKIHQLDYENIIKSVSNDILSL